MLLLQSAVSGEQRASRRRQRVLSGWDGLDGNQAGCALGLDRSTAARHVTAMVSVLDTPAALVAVAARVTRSWTVPFDANVCLSA
jgi:hypothetical protein